MEEIEWRVVRPLGYDDCWFLGTRSRGKYKTQDDMQMRKLESNPRMRVMEFVRGTGWINRQVRARLWIAEIFYEWDNVEDRISGIVSGYISKKGKRVVFERGRSHWMVTMKCGDDRCINPAHFTFSIIGHSKAAPTGYTEKGNK